MARQPDHFTFGSAADEFVNPVTSDWERTTLALLEDGDKRGFHKAISEMLMNHERHFNVMDIAKADDGDNQLTYDEFHTHFDSRWDDAMSQAVFNEIKGDSVVDFITILAFHRYTQGPKKKRVVRKLSANELYQKLKECDFVKTFHADTDEVPRREFIEHFAKDFEEEDIAECFDEIDDDGMGTISLREFNVWRWTGLTKRIKAKPTPKKAIAKHKKATAHKKTPPPPMPKETDDDIVAVARAAATVIQDKSDDSDGYLADGSVDDGKLEDDRENLETVKDTLLSIMTTAPGIEHTAEDSPAFVGYSDYTPVAGGSEHETHDRELFDKVSAQMLETAKHECRAWIHVFSVLQFIEVLRLFAVIMFCRKLHVASEWRIGTMIASNFLVRGCVGMALSLASDSWSSQHTFERFWLAQMCALVLGFALEAFAVNFAMFCVGFMLTAFGPNHELLLVYVNRMLPPNSAERVLAPKNVRMCVAAALAPAISGTLAHFLGRREPFLAAFVCGIALILVSLRLVGKEITTKDELFHRYCGRLEATDAASIGTQTLSTFICALTAYMLATSVLLAMIVWHAHFGKEHCDANMFESGFQVSLLLLVIAALSVPHSSIVQMRKELATLWLLAALSAAALMAVVPMVDRHLGHVGFWFMLPAAAVCLAPVAAVCQRLMDAVQISEALHASVFCAPRIFCVALCKAVVCVVIANWYNRKHTVAFKVASVSLLFASIPALVQLTSFKEETVPQTKDYVKL